MVRHSARNPYITLALTALIAVLVDQYLKWQFCHTQSSYDISIAASLFSLDCTTNTGAAFSILRSYGSALMWLGIFAVGMALYYYDRLPKAKLTPVFAGLLIGGIIGNIIDRAVYGYVIDFIRISIWPTFNIADACLTVGIIGIIFLVYRDDVAMKKS